MENTSDYERYPAWIVVVCNLVSLSIYAIGAYVLSTLTAWLSTACGWRSGCCRKAV